MSRVRRMAWVTSLPSPPARAWRRFFSTQTFFFLPRLLGERTDKKNRCVVFLSRTPPAPTPDGFRVGGPGPERARTRARSPPHPGPALVSVFRRARKQGATFQAWRVFAPPSPSRPPFLTNALHPSPARLLCALFHTRRTGVRGGPGLTYRTTPRLTHSLTHIFFSQASFPANAAGRGRGGARERVKEGEEGGG